MRRRNRANLRTQSPPVLYAPGIAAATPTAHHDRVINLLPDVSFHEAAELLLAFVAFVFKALIIASLLFLRLSILLLWICLAYLLTGRPPYKLRRMI